MNLGLIVVSWNIVGITFIACPLGSFFRFFAKMPHAP